MQRVRCEVAVDCNVESRPPKPELPPERRNLKKGHPGTLLRVAGAGHPLYIVQFDNTNAEARIHRNSLTIGENWPFQVIADHRATSASELDVQVDDWGKILGYSMDMKQVKVEVHNPENPKGRKGHVPIGKIQPGLTKQYGHWTIDNQIVPRDPTILAPGTSDSKWRNHRIFQLVKMLLDNMFDQRSRLPSSDILNIERIDTSRKREELADQMTEGFKAAGVLDVLNKDDAKLTDLIKHTVPAAADAIQSAGLYFRFYSGNVKPTFYIGSAETFVGRGRTYEFGKNKERSEHARTQRRAQNLEYRVLCRLQDLRVLKIAENVAFLLFGSYHPLVRHSRALDRLSATASLSDAVQSTTQSDMISVSDSDFRSIAEDISSLCDDVEDDELSKAAHFRRFQLQARVFLSISAAVFPCARFTPMLERPDFGGEHGPIHTLNISSPFCEKSTGGATLVRTYARAQKITYYRRTPYKAILVAPTPKQKYIRVCPALEVAELRTPLEIKLDPASNVPTPQPGDLCHVIFEKMDDGFVHQFQWATLPDCCLYEDASRARTLGIQVQWHDKKGQWWARYLQSGFPNRLYNENLPGSFTTLGIAIGILNSLEGHSFKTVGNPANLIRPFDRAFPLFNVVEVDFDPVKQELIIRHKPPLGSHDGRWKAPGRARTFADKDAQLKNLGAQDMTLNRYPLAGKKPGRVRTKCDRCFLTQNSGYPITCINSATNKCEPESTSSPGCVVCAAFGVPCTYTEDIKERPALVYAIWPRKQELKPFAIVAPDLQSTSPAVFNVTEVNDYLNKVEDNNRPPELGDVQYFFNILSGRLKEENPLQDVGNGLICQICHCLLRLRRCAKKIANGNQIDAEYRNAVELSNAVDRILKSRTSTFKSLDQDWVDENDRHIEGRLPTSQETTTFFQRRRFSTKDMQTKALIQGHRAFFKRLSALMASQSFKREEWDTQRIEELIWKIEGTFPQ